jgi:excisionase family DNA binding protein
MSNIPEQELLTTDQVAEYLSVTPETVRRWRGRGEGPPAVKIGAGRAAPVRYFKAAVVRWLEQLEA